MAHWLIDTQRRATAKEIELFVIAPRGAARERLRARAVGSIVTLIDQP